MEAEASATVVPPEAKEEGLLEASPDTLCATGSLTPPHPPSLADRLPGVATALPPPAPERTVRPRRQPLPLAIASARASESQPLHWDRSPARARLVVPEIPSARTCSRAEASDLGWGEGGSHLPSQPAEASKPSPSLV